MSYLLFIDTNIMLDFYRVRAREGGLGILKHLDANRSLIVTTAQIEMEYKKNRQAVILESIKSLKPPDWNSMALPPVLADGALKKSIGKARALSETLGRDAVARVEMLLREPARTDPVYKVLQKLFRARSPFNLASPKDFERIQSLALHRFALGFPPRKTSDTSCGDSVNWEWIIDCASRSTGTVIIVSRDSDYGVIQKDESFLNDWLHEEFRSRVGRKRSIILSSRLPDAFKRANVTVTRAEEEAEQTAIESRTVAQPTTSPPHKSVTEMLEEVRKLLEASGWSSSKRFVEPTV